MPQSLRFRLPRKSHPRVAYGRRTDNKSTSVRVSATVRAAMELRWPGAPSRAVLFAITRCYGAAPPETIADVRALRCAAPIVDAVSITIKVPRAWWQWCAVERIPMSALVNDALVRVLFLGE